MADNIFGIRIVQMQGMWAMFHIAEKKDVMSARGMVKRRAGYDDLRTGSGLATGPAQPTVNTLPTLLMVFIFWLVFCVCARGVLRRLADAIDDGFSRATCGTRKAGDDSSVTAARFDDGEGVAASVSRGDVSEGGGAAVGGAKEKPQRSSLLAFYKRLVPRRYGHGRTVSSASCVTAPLSFDTDGSPGETNLDVSVVSAGGRVDGKSTRGISTARSRRWKVNTTLDVCEFFCIVGEGWRYFVTYAVSYTSDTFVDRTRWPWLALATPPSYYTYFIARGTTTVILSSLLQTRTVGLKSYRFPPGRLPYVALRALRVYLWNSGIAGGLA